MLVNLHVKKVMAITMVLVALDVVLIRYLRSSLGRNMAAV